MVRDGFKVHGDLTGATGAVELISAIMAITRSALPPTANLRVPDLDCDLDYVPNSSHKGVSLLTVMSDSFASGGEQRGAIARAFEGWRYRQGTGMDAHFSCGISA